MAYKVSRATGSAALSLTHTPSGSEIYFYEFRIHLGAASATSENLVIKIDAAAGAAYDTVLDTQDMNTLADYVYLPARPHRLFAGDKIIVTWTNTNTETYGAEVITS